MNRKWILGSLAVGSIVAVWACGGATTNNTGGGTNDAGNDAASGSSSGATSSGSSGSSGGSSGSSSGATSSGGSSGSSSGTSGSSSGSFPSDGGEIVEGGTFPCGQAVCNPPNVCCESAGGGMGMGATPTCESASSCKGVAESCTADTCPSGSLCCGSLAIGTGGVSGSTECVAGTQCPTGTDALCTSSAMCPAGETCAPLRLGGGMGGAGGTEVCQKPVNRPDGGNFPPPKDAGAGD